MIQLNSTANKSLKIILKNTNKALQKVLEDASQKDLKLLSKAKDLPSLLNSLLKNTSNDEAQNAQLLHLLKSNPTLKELGNVLKSLENLQRTLQKTNLPQIQKLQKRLIQLTQNMQNIDANSLKNKLENSGVFLESKLKHALSSTKIEELFSNDLKALITQTTEELQRSSHPHKQELLQQLDKLKLQIDYYQLLSHLSNSSVVYIPYAFDALEEGSIKFKSAKNKKFFCDIELTLQEYGNLKLRLGLFEKNQLNITIECESETLQKKLQDHLTQLKENLFHAGLHPQDIRFVKKKKQQTSLYNNSQDLELGFEVKA